MPLVFQFLNQKKTKQENRSNRTPDKHQVPVQKPQENPDFKSLSDPSLNSSSNCSGGHPENSQNHFPNLLSKSEYLPDVADNEAEREIAEKRRASGSLEKVQCDLVSQLDAETTEDDEGREDAEVNEDNPLENPVMVSSFFDDNGNPVDEEEENNAEFEEQRNDMDGADVILQDLEVEVVNNYSSHGHGDDDDVPKYFINAATLSDEEFTPEIAASPLCERKSSLPKNEVIRSPTGDAAVIMKPKVSSTDKPSHIPRARVPISKSFPDIIQTTILLNSDEDEDSLFKTTADFDTRRKSTMSTSSRRSESKPSPGMLDSLIADSLEEIAIGRQTEGYGNPKAFDRMDLDSIMTDSVSGIGISGEKPPESWIVDFNSFSLESEFMEEACKNSSRIPVALDREKSNPSSNSNSLAFFINMDEAEVEPEPEPSSSADQKKIFSMFVDLGKEEEKVPVKPQQHPAVINKSVKSVLNSGDETLMIKGKPCSAAVLGKKYPSPNFPHKSGESMKKLNHQKDKMKTELMAREMCSSLSSDHGVGSGTNSESHEQGNVSNRSSLHVANYADGSFTASSLLSSMETSAPEGSLMHFLTKYGNKSELELLVVGWINI